ncbi:hypothetical protein M3O75_32465 (plasmid) [Klebsiella pneumoniae]|nr:hypothetical protein [Klebsiella pneumoniae]
MREGQESVAQISGTREQSVLNGLIRDSLRQEVLGERHDHYSPDAGVAGQQKPGRAGLLPGGDGDGTLGSGDPDARSLCH